MHRVSKGAPEQVYIYIKGVPSAVGFPHCAGSPEESVETVVCRQFVSARYMVIYTLLLEFMVR